MQNDHDPFNEPETAHPRARELMAEPFLWDCLDEESPFGSDEGHEAYYEFRAWRQRHPKSKLVECFDWILVGELENFSEALCSEEAIARDLRDPDAAFLADHYDMFTLDTTIISTALGQLLDEGRIDEDAKPFVRIAIRRQRHPKVVTSPHREEILTAVERVIDAA